MRAIADELHISSRTVWKVVSREKAVVQQASSVG
jgi:hypothetical protein